MKLVHALLLLLLTASTARGQSPFSSVTPLGQGTPGAAGVPVLVVTGLPAIGQPAVDLRVTDARPGTAALILCGTAAAPTLLPPFGATLWPGSPFALLPTTIGPGGVSAPLLATPGETPAWLLGVTAVTQGVVLDVAAQGGLAFTGGLSLVVGVGSAAAPLFSDPAVLVPTRSRLLALGDLDGDGRPDIVTASLGGELGVALSTPDGSHLPRPPTATGQDPVGLALSDLDDDGALDVIVSHFKFGVPAQGRVTVHLGLGDGSFGPADETVVGNNVGPLGVADVDGDGRLDVVTCRSDVLLTLPGLGDGTLGALVPTGVGFAGTVPRALELADLDDDGVPDLLAADGTGLLHALRGLGDGTFLQLQVQPTGGVGSDIATGDIDGDGLLDAAVVHVGDADGTTVWLAGLGDGTLGAPITVAAVSPSSSSVAVADVHGDGIPDLVLGESDPQQVFIGIGDFQQGGFAVLPGLGGGAFAPPERVRVGEAWAFALHDVDGDTDLDVVTLTRDGDVVVTSFNPGDGGFTTPAGETDPEMIGANVLDVDLDGVPDLVELVTDPEGRLGWRRGLGDGSFAEVAQIETGIALGSLTPTGDVDGDGQVDLLIFEQKGLQAGVIHVLVGQGPGVYAEQAAPVQTGAFIYYLELADLDADGHLDLVVLEASFLFETPVFTFLGHGDGSFTPAAEISSGEATWYGLATGDVTGDGLVDLVSGPAFETAPGERRLETRPGLGDGDFGDPITTLIDLPVAQYPRLDDLDGDGLLDVVVSSAEVGRLIVARGAGDGTFIEHDEHAVGRPPFRAEIVDLNRDGALDLTVPALEGGSVCVLLGFGDAGFAPAQPFTIGSLALAARTADLDGDRWPDLVVSSAAGRSTVLLNRGSLLGSD